MKTYLAFNSSNIGKLLHLEHNTIRFDTFHVYTNVIKFELNFSYINRLETNLFGTQKQVCVANNSRRSGSEEDFKV